jgi:hypothetical protein
LHFEISALQEHMDPSTPQYQLRIQNFQPLQINKSYVNKIQDITTAFIIYCFYIILLLMNCIGISQNKIIF